ncbi:hypothetical protein Tsubulata_038571 [Turnera subulata]|uniref:DUF4283 domain-containing protein n=1 Tax=Turnera subulata TaxID=218843 RepID=A0A9Q0JJJ6_9ROSI|nr:hypothetical protein Tsubulata_038571 [Turnera subulata]
MLCIQTVFLLRQAWLGAVAALTVLPLHPNLAVSAPPSRSPEHMQTLSKATFPCNHHRTRFTSLGSQYQSGSTPEDMHETLRNKPSALAHLFSEFRLWKDGDSAINRLCWVLIRGIPPPVWNEDFLKAITARFGTMIDCSQDTKSKTRLDVAEVLVLTTDFGSLNRVFSVKVGAKQYKIGVTETQHDPLEWEWSSPPPPPDGGRATTSSCSNVQTPFQAASPLTRQPDTSCQIPDHSGNADVSVSHDPFNLNPVIKKLMTRPAPSNVARPALSSKSIPSELSYHDPNTQNTADHANLIPHMIFPTNSNQPNGLTPNSHPCGPKSLDSSPLNSQPKKPQDLPLICVLELQIQVCSLKPNENWISRHAIE